MSKFIGTTIPNSGFVGTIYGNTNESCKRVNSVLSRVTYVANPFLSDPIYPILVSASGQPVIFAMKDNDYYEITLVHNLQAGSFEYIYQYDPTDLNNSGWKKDSLEINTNVVDSFSGLAVGSNNNLLNGILSISEFSMPPLKSVLKDIANAIREKSDSEGLIKTIEMSDKISELPKPHKDMLQAWVDEIGSCQNMFKEYKGSNIDFIKDLDLSNITIASSMFNNCTNLTSIPLLNTRNIANMNSMFYHCHNLTTIPPLDTSNVTTMSAMFLCCYNLTTIPQLNTRKVTSMERMFSECGKLTTIQGLDTRNVTDMSGMFTWCKKLITIPVLNTNKVTNMSKMFDSCEELKSVKLNTSKVQYWTNMFVNCYKIDTIDITNYSPISTYYASNIFNSCRSLKKLIIRKYVSTALTSDAFTKCYHLTGTVDETYNPNGDKDCYIYVPRDRVDALKSATNWSTYADQIRALEDYTVDGTTDGDLDETKI